MTIAIRTEGLGKEYTIRHEETGRHGTLRDALAGTVSNLFGGSWLDRSSTTETFRALDDINFEIRQGEKVGIIGRNGAGKSTLLKVLSRITEPTAGRVMLNGRVSSLLEVGTGFHPELSGRENIYLNGAILGMSRAEIRAKFDQIVDFAEVEKFLDTPVKRYSSGMYVRLAFAVAAHLDPEIMIVDEVLAVGDAVFQKKCLNTMREASSSGATVLLVSHNMSTINSLCDKAMLLEDGGLTSFGEAGEVVSEYMAGASAVTRHIYSNPDAATREGKATMLEATVLGSDGKDASTLYTDQLSSISLVWRLNEDVPVMRVGIDIVDTFGQVVLSSMDTDTSEWKDKPRQAGVYTEIMRLPAFMLMPGVYRVRVFAGTPKIERYIDMDDLLQFTVIDNDTHLSHFPGTPRRGYCAMPVGWEVDHEHD